MNLSVIIPTYNGRHLLEQTLAHNIERLGSQATQWLIADDGSTDDTATWIATHHPTITYIRSTANHGFAATVAMGAAQATGTHLLFLNNDMAIQTWDWDTLVAAFNDETLFALVPQIIRPSKDNNFESITWGKFEGGWLTTESYAPAQLTPQTASGRPVLWACGGAMVVPRAKYDALDGFDPLFSPFYFEDLDLSYRAWKQGWSSCYLNFALVHHQHQATIGRLFTPSQITYFHRTNHYLMMWKNLDDPRYKINHFLTALIKILTLQLTDCRAILAALRRLPEIRRYRLNRPTPTASDRQILESVWTALHDPQHAMEFRE
ncbi:glycosyltransferase family 2 protein [bacterium]|nr:glycosyltransferase family 2 protein [bacterium]